MSRRRFKEWEVLAALIHQGVKIRSFRSGEPITLENVKRVQREHLHEVKLGGPDEPENCRYSLDTEHSVITNGTKATTLGSSKHVIAKTKRLERERNGEPKRARDKYKKPIRSQGFDKTKSRKFDGTIVERQNG